MHSLRKQCLTRNCFNEHASESYKVEKYLGKTRNNQFFERPRFVGSVAGAEMNADRIKFCQQSLCGTLKSRFKIYN
jgi:hypothetical protein